MNKYQRTVRSKTIDVYDVLNAYEVDSHAVGHAIKKLLMAGQRGHKDRLQDLREAIQAIEREIDMSTPVDHEKRATGDSGASEALLEGIKVAEALEKGFEYKITGLRERHVDYTDGEWHDWHGGECPVPGDVEVAYELSDGYKSHQLAESIVWFHFGFGRDVIRFMVIK